MDNRLAEPQTLYPPHRFLPPWSILLLSVSYISCHRREISIEESIRRFSPQNIETNNILMFEDGLPRILVKKTILPEASAYLQPYVFLSLFKEFLLTLGHKYLMLI